MAYRILFAALIAMSASVDSAAPAVLDAGDALEARMAKLEATVNELEFADKVKKLAEEHGIKEQDVKEQWGNQHGSFDEFAEAERVQRALANGDYHTWRSINNVKFSAGPLG